MRLQSAIEYLTTYGWALLILAVSLAALFAFGVFSPGGIINQQCLLQAGFSCLSFYMAQNGLLTINILQATQSPINITAMGCYQNASRVQLQLVLPQAYLPIGSNHTFNLQCYSYTGAFSGKINSAFTGSLALNYTNTATGFPQIAYGSIIVKITS